MTILEQRHNYPRRVFVSTRDRKCYINIPRINSYNGVLRGEGRFIGYANPYSSHPAPISDSYDITPVLYPKDTLKGVDSDL